MLLLFSVAAIARAPAMRYVSEPRSCAGNFAAAVCQTAEMEKKKKKYRYEDGGNGFACGYA